MGPDNRRAFLTHLAGCRACDHAFRIFALTAPVLYGDLANRPAAKVLMPGPKSAPAARADDGGHPRFRPVSGFVIVAAVAAAITVYLTLPPHVTFEDAIVEGDSSVARTTYSPVENLFWPDGSGPRSHRSDPDQPAIDQGKHHNLAS